MAQPDENPGRGATGTGKFPPSGMRAADAGPASGLPATGGDPGNRWRSRNRCGTGNRWGQPPYGARPGTHPQADASSGEAPRANSVLDRPDLMWWETCAQTLSNGVIAAVALGSLLAFTPFTDQYARESVPRQYWDSPLSRRTNRILTVMWGGVFLVTALLGLLART